MSPRWNLVVVLSTQRVAFFCMDIFFSFIRLNLFSLKVLFAFKNTKQEIGTAYDYE